jgi:hypothetical protein
MLTEICWRCRKQYKSLENSLCLECEKAVDKEVFGLPYGHGLVIAYVDFDDITTA